MSVKEKREIAFILGSVALVVFFGIFVSFLDLKEGVSSGKAIDINANHPTYAGFLQILENSGQWVEANSQSCDDVCSSIGSICIPLEHTCSDIVVSGNCRCVEVPQ